MTPVIREEIELINRSKALVTVALVAALTMSATPVNAVPGSKLAQAQAVKKQVDALDHRVEVAAERYNEASAQHGALLNQKQAAEKRLKKTRARMKVVQRHLNVRAKSMYRSGPLGFMDVLLGAESFDEFASTWDVLSDLNASDADSVKQLKVLRKEYDREHKVVSAKEKAAADKKAEMQARYSSIQGDLATRKAKLAGLESEIAQLEDAERRARAAQASSYVSARPSEANWPAPTRQPRSSVVNIARRYLGVPYVWGGASPSGFDCSGLVMYVYQQVGVSLPHSSRAQINSGQRVSRANLQPGDLVFFGSPIHHVGIYVGGGMMIHAPHTGAVVRIDPLHSDYSGACRP